MGRVKVQLKKIENKTYRHITFAKRKSGLVKKAFEISTLCDVEVALVIFSPAGKLIIFEGKKRVEEILMHYIDLPHHQRGRLHDQELVNRIVAQLSLEAELRHQLASSSARDSKMSIDSQLEEIKHEICICNLEMEEVEKQLQYILKIPSCIKSKVEADYYEEIVEETLKLVVIHKQVLEAKRVIQLAYHAEKQLYPQAAIPGGFMMGSSNYYLELPQQHDARILTSNFANATGFRSFRNQTQPLAEMLQSSYPASNAVSNVSAFDGYTYQSEYDKFFNADIPFGMINVRQETATKVACHGSCSSHRYCGCAIPFLSDNEEMSKMRETR